MKLKKGSAAAKAYMAKIRAKKGKITTRKKSTIKKIGSEDTRVYIEFLNKDKNFKKDIKYFKNDDAAIKWGRENLGRFNIDMIKDAKDKERYDSYFGEVAKNKRVGATLLIEKNETQFTKPKKVYKINRYANGRIKNYDKIEIQQRSVNKKEKFFYKHEFNDVTGKKEYKKYLIAETFFSQGILLYRAKGDRLFTEAETGAVWPSYLLNTRDFKKEMEKGEKGQFEKLLKDFDRVKKIYIEQNGRTPLYT